MFKSHVDSVSTASIPAEDVSVLLEFASTEELESIQKLRKLTAGSGKHKNLIEFLDIWVKLSSKWTSASAGNTKG